MRETILGIALVAIATGVFKLLSPENSFKKQIAFMVACFFTLSCISLFKSGGMDFSDISDALRQEGVYMDYSVEAYRMTQTEIANAIANNIEAAFEENEIPVEEIRVIVDISSSYSISIKQVRLALTAENAGSASAAEELIKKEVGDEIEIVTEIKGQ